MLAARYGLARGFDHYDDDVLMDRERIARGGERIDAGAVTGKALDWLAAREEPFFLWLHYYDPHASYRPPPPFDARFAERPYDGEIAYVDHELGRVLDALADDGRLEETLVVVTADHGESLGEHGELTHAYSVYDATQRVPLILHGPRIPRGRVVEGVVGLADLAPTVLAWAGAPAIGDGSDLAARWETPGETPPGSAYAETLATRIDNGWAPVHALRTDAYLYVDVPRPELYRVDRDPDQERNLLPDPCGDHAEALDELRAELARRRQQSAPADELAVDAETLAELEALGYRIPAEPVAATGLDPKDGLALLARFHEAEAANHAGRFAEGEAILRELLREQPGSATLHEALASTYLATNEAARALPHARRAAELVPGSVDYALLLAKTRHAAGDLAAAVDSAEHAAALDAADPRARMLLLDYEAARGRTEEAIRWGEEARGLDPGNVAIARRIADTWEAAGRSPEALDAYRAVLRLDPESWRDHMHAAVHLARLGRVEESEAHRAQAGPVARDPRALRMLAQAHADAGRPERARAILRELLERAPGESEARAQLEALETAQAERSR